MNLKRIIGNRVAVQRLVNATTIERPANARPEPFFEAAIVALGDVKEPVSVGDRVCVQHCGSQKAFHNGQPVELISVLDIVFIHQ